MKLHQILWYLLILLLPVQLGKHFWFDFSLVNGIRIDYLSPTLYLTDLLVIGILISWVACVIPENNVIPNLIGNLYRSWIKSRMARVKHGMIIILVFFLLLVNCLFSQNTGAAFYQLVKILEFVLLGIYIIKNQYRISDIQYPLSLAVLYSALLAILQFIKQGSLGGIFYWLGERTFTVGTPGIAKTIIDGQLFLRSYATFPHPNVLAGFLLISLILTFSYWKKRSRKFLAVYLFISILAIILTFSRVVWLAGTLILLFTVIANKVFTLKTKFSGKQSRLGLPRSLRSLAMTVLIIFTSLAFIILFNNFSNIFREESFLRRVELNNAAIQMIQHSPIFGVGLNQFIVQLSHQPSVLGLVYWLQPVHNIFLLVAAETGIVGFLIFIWFIFISLKRLLIPNYQLLITLIAILFLGLFDHYWLTLQQGQLLFTIVLGMSWSKIKT